MAVLKNLHQFGGDDRRLLGGFHDDGVARHDRGGRHAGQNRQREIPRSDDGGDSARLEEVRVLFASQIDLARSEQILGLQCVVLAEVDCLSDVCVGFDPRFATLVNLPRGEFEASLSHRLCNERQVLAANFQVCASPFGERLASSLDRTDDVIGRRGADRANDFALLRRVATDDATASFDRPTANHQRVLATEFALHELHRFQKRIANAVDAEVGQRLVLESRQC